jgi:hypothetical protein
MRILASSVSFALLVLVAPSRAQTPDWHFTATVAESCSCAVACRCNFGGEPDGGKCEGNRIISIEKGHYNNVDLSGVQLLITFQMRTWSKVYVGDRASDEQMKALEALLPVAFAGFQKGMLSFAKAPVTMDVGATRVRFSGPESSVDMEAMRGSDGQPVRILNLPSAVFQNYTQFRSISHTHTSATHTWTHSGTNGFTSTWDVGGGK